MGVSVVTLALAKKYAVEKATAAFDEAVLEAVTQSKAYTDAVVGEMFSFKVKIVDSLPTTDIDEHTIYFVKRKNPSGGDDFYYEYMYINGKWEIIGSTELDLSGYWTSDQVKAYVDEKKYVLPVATSTTLGGVKVNGESIVISSDGVIGINDTYVENHVSSYMDDDKTIENADIDILFN